MPDLLTKLRGVPAGALTRLGRPLPMRGHGAAVLCYHDIGTDAENPTDYYVSPTLLGSHLEWIRDWGFTIVPLAEIVDRLAQDRDLDGLIAITFDDALIGVHDHGAAILEAAGAPATVFVVTDVLGVAPPFWPGAARTMTEEELRALTASGLVTLGSHTARHVSLPDVDPGTRTRELSESLATLRGFDARDRDLLAYPSGHHDPTTEHATVAAGYRAGFTFSFGRVTRNCDPFSIPRFCIGPAHDRFRLARQLARPASAW
ncbi:MAG: polysaccharide deacetylase family protein [Acidimicrobiia bacterium]|nr:polysaccharide deacetylase family protein [Acidimicrobiia bacterium]